MRPQTDSSTDMSSHEVVQEVRVSVLIARSFYRFFGEQIFVSMISLILELLAFFGDTSLFLRLSGVSSICIDNAVSQAQTLSCRDF